MSSHTTRALVVCSAALMVSCATYTPEQGGTATKSLAGSSWQLVQFRGGDDTKVSPDDKGKYTVAFVSDSEVAVRFDCNRGRGTWKSAQPALIEFGPLAMTRAMCASRGPAMKQALVRHVDQKPLTFKRPPVATLPFNDPVGTLAERTAFLIVE